MAVERPVAAAGVVAGGRWWSPLRAGPVAVVRRPAEVARWSASAGGGGGGAAGGGGGAPHAAAPARRFALRAVEEQPVFREVADTLRRSVAPRPSVIRTFPRDRRAALRAPPDSLPRASVRRRGSTRARRSVGDQPGGATVGAQHPGGGARLGGGAAGAIAHPGAVAGAGRQFGGVNRAGITSRPYAGNCAELRQSQFQSGQ